MRTVGAPFRCAIPSADAGNNLLRRSSSGRQIVGPTFAAASLCALLVLLLGFAVARAESAAPKPPDRRELWVPVDKLGFVLDNKAVLLTREQYKTLLRDAEREKGPKSEAPVAAVISNAEFRAVPDGKTAVIHAELRVNVLRDGWCEVPLDFPGAAIGEMKFDGEAAMGEAKPGGEGVLTPRNPALRAEPPPQAAQKKAAPERPALLLVRGRGEHRLTFEITATIHAAGGVSTFALGVPTVAAGSFTLVLPAGATMEKIGEAMRVSKTVEATTATVALSPARNAVAFAWKAGAENDAKIPVRAQAIVRYDIDAEKVSGSYQLHLEATLGDLPLTFEFALPAGVKVLAVRAEELRGWEAKGGKIVAKFQDGSRKELDLEIGVELQPVIGKEAAATVLPMPVLQGASRFDGVLHIAGADNVTIKDVTADARMRRMPTSEDRGERGFFGAYEFSGSGVVPKVVIERAVPGLESDLDTLVEFRSDAIFITRTLTLREQKGRRFSTAITLPASEEFLGVRRIEEAKPVAGQPAAQGILPNTDANTETEPEWTREGGKVLIKWSDEAAKPRVFRVRTRIEPEKWAQLPAEGISLMLGDAKIADSAKVTGYIALTADPAFRIEAQPGETLERRDGRSTPVHGEYAWFRRDAFDLTIKIARRPSEVLAALTGYVLPLEGVLDVRAAMNYQFMGGGTRAVKIRVPKDLAQNFHFEGPQIAERALDGDVWTVTFQKELTGAYALGITAQVPVAKQAGDGNGAKNGNKNGNGNGSSGGKGYSFAVKVPVISPLDVVRASGLWAVEANTETEITFDARGMNELDSLLAPQLADYAPRHRVIGVFGWLGADYALTLNGVRHAPAGMLAAVVDSLELNTVISTSGTHRHEAIYRLRASGVEYFDVALPQGAQLLSTVIDGTAVKPVADRPGSVRLPLPAKRDANTGVIASLVYETSGGVWKNRGKLALGAPSIAAGIPVLKSTWRVWVPEGFSFSDIESNLPVPESPQEKPLALALSEKIGDIAFGGFFYVEKRSQATQALEDLMTMESAMNQYAAESAARTARENAMVAITKKLNTIRFPKIDFRDSTLSEAVEFLNQKAKQLDSEEQGVSIVLDGVTDNADAQRITMTLNNVPLIEVIKYITNLSNLKFKIEPNRVRFVPIGFPLEELVIKQWNVPASFFRALSELETPPSKVAGVLSAKEFLTASGVVFPQGAFALYRAADNILVVKNTEDQIDLIDRTIEVQTAPPVPPEDDRVTSTATVSAPNTIALDNKVGTIIFPKIDFKDVTVREACEFLAAKSKALDPLGEGVNIVLRLGDEAHGGGTRITLSLNNVPLIEVIKYVTNLANLKYKIEPFAVNIVPIGTQTEELFIKQWKVPPSLFRAVPESKTPIAGVAGAEGTSNAKDFLAASGVTFQQGAFAMYSPASSTLIVKGTQDQLDLVGRIIDIESQNGPTAAVKPAPAMPQSAIDDARKFSTAHSRSPDLNLFGRPRVNGWPNGGKTAGLLPVMLDLPKSGPVLVFDGLFAPERVVMRYDDWWSRARALWMWFVSGGIAFYLIEARRPWWRTLWAVLVMSALPLCVSVAWMPVCNGVLGGWLAGLALNRVGVWCVFPVKKEVLA